MNLIDFLEHFYLFNDLRGLLKLLVLESLHIFLDLIVLTEHVNHALEVHVLVSCQHHQVRLLALLSVYVLLHNAALPDRHDPLQLPHLLIHHLQFYHLRFQQFTQLYLWQLFIVDQFE